MPNVEIKKSLFTFTPKYLQLSETTVNIGKNDITADSRFENYIGYVLKGTTLKGTLNIHSNYFNLNDFMTASADSTATADAATTDSTTVTGIVEVPKNIDFQMDANLKQVLFDKMTFNNMNGKLVVKDGKVDMKNLSMSTMGGNVVMNGYYSTANAKKPEMKAGFKLTNLSFSQAYKELDMVQQLAPIFENCNLANDHNQLVMDLMKRIARKHHFNVLLHEKPYSGVNGSGKHNNWSLCTDTGVNLFAPGKNPKGNMLFLTFLVNALMMVYKNQDLLRASIMSASNSYRLGANEAPPAILSCFLGSQLSSTLDEIVRQVGNEKMTPEEKTTLKLGIGRIPEILLDTTDRNRTSPFAFTGNRFEFRAVGSSDNCAEAMIVLNAAMAHELAEFKQNVDAKIEAGMKKEKAIYEVLKQMIKACKAIRFDGNGYSDEWKAEARKRGLDCETSTPLIFDRYLDKQTLRMFGDTGVFSKVELEARTEVKWETYTKKIQIEGRVLGDLAMNHIVPIASKYEALLLDKVYKMSQIPGLNASADIELIKKIQYHTAEIQRLTAGMVDARKVANRIEDQREKAIAYHDTVAACFDEIRRHIDKLEEIVDDQMWPLPKYRELLFLR